MNFLLLNHLWCYIIVVQVFIIYLMGENCRQPLHRQLLLLSNSNTFYISPLFTTASLEPICYFNCWQFLHRQFLLLSNSSTFYFGSLFTTASLQLIYYLAASRILSRDIIVLFFIQQRSFLIFWYKALEVLLRLVKGFNAILCGKNIYFFFV